MLKEILIANLNCFTITSLSKKKERKVNALNIRTWVKIGQSIKTWGLENKALTSKVKSRFTAESASFSCMHGHTSIGYYHMLDIEEKYKLTDILVLHDGKDAQGQQRYKIITVEMSVMFYAWIM